MTDIPDQSAIVGEGQEPVALVDLLDRLMTGGVVVTGDVLLSIAGVDLVYLGLRVVLTSVDGLSRVSSTPSPEPT